MHAMNRPRTSADYGNSFGERASTNETAGAARQGQRRAENAQQGRVAKKRVWASTRSSAWSRAGAACATVERVVVPSVHLAVEYLSEARDWSQ